MNTKADDMFGLPDDENMRKAIMDAEPDGLSGSKWTKTLVEYVQVLERLYVRQGKTEADAFKQAAASVLELAEHRGGKVEYLPRGDALRTALRHAEIYRRGNGKNHDALADEFGISVIQVYRIQKQQHKLHVKKVQPALPFPKQEVVK